MLHGYATEGSLGDMIDLCELMAGDGVVPNLHVYHILIGAFAKCGRMDGAMLFFEDMLKHGLNPNEVTYLTVIAALCRMGRMDDAMDKFNEMIDMGVPHEITRFRCMIQVYLKHGDFKKAKELIAKTKKKDISQMRTKDIGHHPRKGN
jgi:pentatricopeptide repeat protein